MNTVKSLLRTKTEVLEQVINDRRSFQYISNEYFYVVQLQ